MTQGFNTRLVYNHFLAILKKASQPSLLIGVLSHPREGVSWVDVKGLGLGP